MKNSIKLLALVAVGLMSASRASATSNPVFYTDPATFGTDSGGTFLQLAFPLPTANGGQFESVGTSLTLAPVTYTVGGGGAMTLYHDAAFTPANYYYLGAVGADLTVTFTGTQHYIAFALGMYNTGGSISVSANGRPATTFSVPGGPTPQFVGVGYLQPITSLVFHDTSGSFGNIDLVAPLSAAPSVPEPSTLALAGLSLAGLFMARRRRQ
ncbi:MAG: PEP-CTERM sorting domain-containing protein [Verrucomicrobiota bacterium]